MSACADKPRLLFLHTGGTLGMALSGTGPLKPSDYAAQVLDYITGLDEIARIEGHVVAALDSTDMTPALWERLAELIVEHRDDFDGFVVIHGTDTMAYTACALSYMLQDLDRPVVLTGSQRPLAEARTDARMNLVHSAICATMPVPEVGLYFGGRLFRGNRATKTSVWSYDAFRSPHLPPLVEMGVDVVAVTPPLQPQGPLRYQPGFATDVAVLTVVPGTGAAMVDAAVGAGARAVVLRGLGEGNVPQQAWPQAIERATAAGVPVIVASQCRSGAVFPGRYVGSSRARDAGALFSGEMTGEAAVVKAMWLLGQGLDPPTFRQRFVHPLAGEGRGG